MSDSQFEQQNKQQNKQQSKTLGASQSPVKQRKGKVLEDNREPRAPIQRKPNTTGLPDNLKSGMENLSGMSLDHVKVHHNSSKPAAVQAHAYAQGSEIHLGPGQEKHLPHELGHVVQQMQGRVKPTASVGGMAVNDNPALEDEATAMGHKALQRAAVGGSKHDDTAQFKPQFTSMASMGMEAFNYTTMNPQQYAAWKDSEVAQLQPHGHCVSGDTVVVTQLRSDLVLQGDMLEALVGKKKKAWVLGGLLILEGGLTLAAGIALFGITSGGAAIPALMAIIGGSIKIARGLLTIGKAYTTKDSKKEKVITALIDVMRMGEAVVGLIGAFTGKGNPAAAVQNFAKALRSALIMYSDWKGDELKGRKKTIIKSVIAACHTIEASTLGGLAASKGSVMTGVVAGSKTIRASNDGTAAVDAAFEEHEQPAQQVNLSTSINDTGAGNKHITNDML